MSQTIIGVDLGGTLIRVARLDSALNILERREIPTQVELGPERVIERMIELIRSLLPIDSSPLLGIGVSSPGPLNPTTGVVVSPPNLTGWKDVPLAQKLNAAFGVPVYIGKDANVAVLAEAARGAARGYRNVVYVTLSTGIGGGVLVNGRLLLGLDGFASEVGHMVLVVDGKASSVEKEAAGLALAQKARDRIAAGESSIILDMAQGDVAQISSKIVGQAARQGDALALDIVRRAGWIIGLGMVNILHVFNPEMIVIGGGLSNMGDLLFTPMHDAIAQHVIDPNYASRCKFEIAALGENVSIIGAAALVSTEGGVRSFLEG
jgi:glucokinase